MAFSDDSVDLVVVEIDFTSTSDTHQCATARYIAPKRISRRSLIDAAAAISSFERAMSASRIFDDIVRAHSWVIGSPAPSS
eukprot:scaffold28040_cov54-Attheya_sp.AAC.4